MGGQYREVITKQTRKLVTADGKVIVDNSILREDLHDSVLGYHVEHNPTKYIKVQGVFCELHQKGVIRIRK